MRQQDKSAVDDFSIRIIFKNKKSGTFMVDIGSTSEINFVVTRFNSII